MSVSPARPVAVDTGFVDADGNPVMSARPGYSCPVDDPPALVQASEERFVDLSASVDLKCQGLYSGRYETTYRADGIAMGPVSLGREGSPPADVSMSGSGGPYGTSYGETATLAYDASRGAWTLTESFYGHSVSTSGAPPGEAGALSFYRQVDYPNPEVKHRVSATVRLARTAKVHRFGRHPAEIAYLGDYSQNLVSRDGRPFGPFASPSRGAPLRGEAVSYLASWADRLRALSGVYGRGAFWLAPPPSGTGAPVIHSASPITGAGGWPGGVPASLSVSAGTVSREGSAGPASLLLFRLRSLDFQARLRAPVLPASALSSPPSPSAWLVSDGLLGSGSPGEADPSTWLAPSGSSPSPVPEWGPVWHVALSQAEADGNGGGWFVPDPSSPTPGGPEARAVAAYLAGLAAPQPTDLVMGGEGQGFVEGYDPSVPADPPQRKRASDVARLFAERTPGMSVALGPSAPALALDVRNHVAGNAEATVSAGARRETTADDMYAADAARYDADAMNAWYAAEFPQEPSGVGPDGRRYEYMYEVLGTGETPGPASSVTTPVPADPYSQDYVDFCQLANPSFRNPTDRVYRRSAVVGSAVVYTVDGHVFPGIPSSDSGQMGGFLPRAATGSVAVDVVWPSDVYGYSTSSGYPDFTVTYHAHRTQVNSPPGLFDGVWDGESHGPANYRWASRYHDGDPEYETVQVDEAGHFSPDARGTARSGETPCSCEAADPGDSPLSLGRVPPASPDSVGCRLVYSARVELSETYRVGYGRDGAPDDPRVAALPGGVRTRVWRVVGFAPAAFAWSRAAGAAAGSASSGGSALGAGTTSAAGLWAFVRDTVLAACGLSVGSPADLVDPDPVSYVDIPDGTRIRVVRHDWDRGVYEDHAVYAGTSREFGRSFVESAGLSVGVSFPCAAYESGYCA